jgi:hypothetical protein
MRGRIVANKLTAQDRKNLLEKFRVTKKVETAAALCRLSDSEARKLFSIGDKGTMSGIGFNGYDLRGVDRGPYCIRLDEVTEGKYRSLPGSDNRYLYCLPAADKLKDAPVVIVESPKSVLAIASAAERSKRPVLAVATNGCWGWKQKDDEESQPIGDLDQFRDRDVIVCLDSNVATKRQVARAEKALAAHLLCTVKARSVKCVRVPLEVNGPDDYLAAHKDDRKFWALVDSAREPWTLGDTFASYENFLAAPEPSFLVDSLLQDVGVTFLGALPGHGKTWVLLSIAKALLTGKKLFDHFKVKRTVPRIIYLSPEVQLGQMRTRIQRFPGLKEAIQDGRLLLRTLTEGPTPDLLEPDVLMAARGSVVILDTAVRFSEGVENAAESNRDGLGAKCFALLNAGALTIIASHHAPKAAEGTSALTLQNMLRGSGELGAFLSGAWGLFQLDDKLNTIYIANLKPRDQDPFAPFIIAGRPYINDKGDFRVTVKPGDCPPFADCRPKKAKAGKQPAPETVSKRGFVQELMATGETSAEKITKALNEKFKTKHPRGSIARWMKPEKF